MRRSPRRVEAAFLAVMDGEVRWAVNGEELRLDKPDGRGLRFRVRATIYPSRELRPLLQGHRDGGDYRFGWQAGKTGIGLEFEWRDGPGKPWGLAGMNRPPAWAVPGPDPLTGAAGHDGFVSGVVARAAAGSSASLPVGTRRSSCSCSPCRAPGPGGRSAGSSTSPATPAS